jgi:hypothetical protein
MSTYVDASSVALKDDIRPVLTTATLNANGTVSLGFSEGVNTVSATTKNDFIITINGVQLTSSGNASITFADGTGADAGKYVLSVATSVLNDDSTYGDVLYIDVNGDNSFTDGTDIVVARQAASGTNYVAGTYNLNNASSITIKTAPSPASVTDASALANKLAGNTEIRVK